tara:strand:- start:9 stop:359 length:351 start_codon:yes stop_codon:yes gene_type:complete
LAKSQTQIGLKAISIKKKSVASAATRNFVAKIKQQFTNADIKPPSKKQSNMSCLDICNSPSFKTNDTVIAISPERIKQGSISRFFETLRINVKQEKETAVINARAFPKKSPEFRAP